MSPVFFGFPFHLADHRALSSIPSAVQSVPISHRFYTEYQYWPCVNSNFSIPPTSPPFFGFWFLLLSLPYSLRRRALAPLLSTSHPRFTCNGSQCPSALRPLHPHQPGFLPMYPLLFFPSWSHGLRRFCTPQIFISRNWKQVFTPVFPCNLIFRRSPGDDDLKLNRPCRFCKARAQPSVTLLSFGIWSCK